MSGKHFSEKFDEMVQQTGNHRAEGAAVTVPYSAPILGNCSKGPVEDTKHIRPIVATPLIFVLDSGGIGLGIFRMQDSFQIVVAHRNNDAMVQEIKNDIMEMNQGVGTE
jgi:hypothetical protein